MRGRLPRWTVLVILLSAPAAPLEAGPNPEDLASIERLQRTLAELADEVRPSVVAIRASRPLATPAEQQNTDADRPGRSDRLIPAVGSGVIIEPDGYILTNEHVIHNAVPEHVECVLSDGTAYTVTGINSDPRSDLAILKIDGSDLRAAPLGHLDNVRQGHFAVVMGNPFGSAYQSHGSPAMSFGIISAIGRELTGQLDPTGHCYYGNLIQTDARINPGNSGGPLINIKGEVIGINTAISTRSGGSEGVGYAIPIDDRTIDIIHSLLAGEEVEYGFLGVHLDDPGPEDRERAGGPASGGAMIIREVAKDSPAGKAGLRSGAIIAEFNGLEIQDVDHLIRAVGRARVGKPAKVVYYEDGHRITGTVVPARRAVQGVAMAYRWRGMRLENPTDEVRKRYDLPDQVRGIVVAHVQADSPAAAAGIEPGQIIQRIAEFDIQSIKDLTSGAARLEGPVEVRLNGDKVLTLN